MIKLPNNRFFEKFIAQVIFQTKDDTCLRLHEQIIFLMSKNSKMYIHTYIHTYFVSIPQGAFQYLTAKNILIKNG